MHVCHRGFPSLYIVFLYMAKNPCTPSSRPDWLEFRLERPVHTTQEKLNSVKMASLYMSSRSSVDRAQARCSGGHGCDSCRGLRFVLCPILVSCRLIHLLQAHICHMKDRAMPDMIHVSLHGRAAKQAILIIITGDDNYLTRPKWQRKPRQKDTKTTAV